MSTYYYENEIQAIDDKIDQCITSKTNLQNKKSTCQTSIDRLNTKNGDLLDESDVKKTNIFEGEMAKALAKKVAEIKSDFKEDVSAAEKVLTAVDSQITAIDKEIANLRSTRKSYQQQLEYMMSQQP